MVIIIIEVNIFVSLGSGHNRKQEMRIKEWVSLSYRTQAPDRYFNPMSQQKRMNSRNNNFATQEKNLYKAYLPKHSASPPTPPDYCELQEVIISL